MLSQVKSPSSWKEAAQKKLIQPEWIESSVQAIKDEGKTIVTLNGSFDLLHAGHLHIIYQAKQQGDCLIIGLNSDRSIQGYKSPNRPIISLPNRLEMMAALFFVDHVTWFDELDPRALLEKIRPHVHVNGAEYGQNCIERATVEKYGGRVHVVDLIPGLSTSEIVKKIQQTCDYSVN